MVRSKTRGTAHSAYISHIYRSQIPEFADYESNLSNRDFLSLGSGFYDRLNQQQFGFTDLKNPPYHDLKTSLYLEKLMSRNAEKVGDLELRVVSGINIFSSMGGSACLSIVTKSGINYVFVEADFGKGLNEVYPIIAEKLFYGQPLLIHHVLRKAVNSLNNLSLP